MAKGGKKSNHSMKNSIQKCRNEEYKNMQERWGPDKLYISSLAPDHTFVYFLFSYQSSTKFNVDHQPYLYCHRHFQFDVHLFI